MSTEPERAGIISITMDELAQALNIPPAHKVTAISFDLQSDRLSIRIEGPLMNAHHQGAPLAKEDLWGFGCRVRESKPDSNREPQTDVDP